MNSFNNIRPLFRVPFKYGVFGSLLGMALIVVLYYTHKHPLLIPPLLDFRILLFGIFIFFGIKEYKEYYNGGQLNFWQGMVIGFIIYIVIGVLVGLFIILFSSLVPEFLHSYIRGTIDGLMLGKDQLVEGGNIKLSEEEFNRQVDMLKTTKPVILALDYLIKSCVIGFFITMILAVLLRKTEKRFS